MLDADGLAYEDLGDGEPVLLIHGGAIAPTFVYLANEDALSEKYRLIRYHRRGFDGSTPLEGEDKLSGQDYVAIQAEDALAVLRHVGVSRAHVVGHSGGGWVGVQLAVDAPEAVHSLVLMEPAIHAIDPEIREVALAFLSPLVELWRSEPERAAKRLLHGVEGAEWRAVAESLGGADVWLADTKRMLFEYAGWGDWLFGAAEAAQISQPVLYVTGGASAGVEMLKEKFQSLVPQTEGVIIPGATHNMLTTHASVLAREVAAFLGRHPV